MKLAEFNDLCHREYANERGIVTRLTLSPPEYAELSADIIGDGIAGTMQPAGTEGILTCGARVTQIINPATTGGPGHPMPVAVGFITPDDSFPFTGSAQVTRWVPVRTPIPPEPAASSDLPPRDVASYTVGG